MFFLISCIRFYHMPPGIPYSQLILPSLRFDWLPLQDANANVPNISRSKSTFK